MDIRLSGAHKSISAGFEWLDVPRFAVVTGENGCGKTHLLSAISTAADLSGTPTGRPSTFGTATGRPSRFGTPQARRDRPQILLVPPNAAVGSVSTGPPSGSPFDVRLANLIAEHSRRFFDAHLKRSQAKLDDLPVPSERPWELVNAVLEKADVPCRLTDPERLKTRLGDSFDAQVELLSAPGRFLRPEDLSPGEAAILVFALWTFGAAHQPMPRLILLDEPDAHLHTSAISRYLDVLQRIFVEENGIGIIMSTHRPDTIAFCPEGTLFELHRSRALPSGKAVPTRVEKISRNRAIANLSANLFSASPSTRCVLVEDEDDATFYGALYNASSHLDLLPRLIFQPASTRLSNSHTRSGGRTVVEGWVEKLCKAGLAPLIQGIVDRDRHSGTSSIPGSVHVLERYSIENYLLDPIVVYASLIRAGLAVQVGISPTETIRPGLEGRLGELENSALQEIADGVLSKVEPALSPPSTAGEREKVDVEFSQGKHLRYPKWLIERRGKDLCQAFRTTLCSAGADTATLLQALDWVRLVPKEIQATFQSIATAVAE